ncbi:MAG TPA: family 20 glycosylhydrolase [Ignavibacteriaceae bacterium]|nr:family 20 glycosylhydrolase [Ignavibacteriaceae bacterium]HPO56136.1 family 20 glycosylhydrolase [Ignavibacteriaceae bacterium]
MTPKYPATIILLVLLILTSAFTVQAQENKINLMPVPSEIKIGKGHFLLDSTFAACVTGTADPRIHNAASRFLRRLANRTGLFIQQDFVIPREKNKHSVLFIQVERPGRLIVGEDESYTLKIEDDEIIVSAVTDLGAMHGLETLLQLLKGNSEGYFFPEVEIKDAPRFPWRGLMIDVSRHFFPLDLIRRNLDAMAAVKMNVFHWHLSDDQGIRVESKVYPKLHELGSDGIYYTQEEIKALVKYAADRGIRVIPEFDVPGHSSAFLTAYPEFASAPGPYKIERRWGIFDPTFDPTIEKTYEFFDRFFGEMTSLFPDEYFHIGGDENNGRQWDNNKNIQKFMKDNNIKDNHELQAYFNKRLVDILNKYNKKMVGWDEILNPDMPKNILIQSWRGIKSLAESARHGYQGILSNGYYIDLVQPASFHYLNDPIPDSLNLSAEEKKFILGGEATSWAELVTLETVESRIWPRTAVIAERLWSPAYVRDVDDMYKRLERMSFLLEEHGLLHQKNYEMMLRRLTDNHDIKALKTIADILEPVKIYNRHFQGKVHVQHSPYTRTVDAARPESMTAREFNLLVDKYIQTKDAPVLDILRGMLIKWESNHAELVKLMEVSPIIKELEPHSLNLVKLSRTALDALDLMTSNRLPSNEWLEQSKLAIENAKKPHGQTEFAITGAVEKLLKHNGWIK